ncbi:MAG TPA: hypothetical protein VFB50_08485, partial [Chloroflexota bacterium]|nr:hypothetical protein [Chloroflexota bacterium]
PNACPHLERIPRAEVLKRWDGHALARSRCQQWAGPWPSAAPRLRQQPGTLQRCRSGGNRRHHLDAALRQDG